MQTYPLSLTPGAPNANIGTDATLFVYESGTSSGDARITVKADNSAEIVLRPGQRFRITERASRWFVSAFEVGATISGNIIIGSGDFEDSNTNNIVTLADGFANTVKVSNTAAERVPVTLDTAQTQPVSIASTLPVSIVGTVNVAGSTVEYTHSFADSSTGSFVAQVIMTPAQNVNGCIVEFAQFEVAMNVGTNNTFSGALIAKAGAVPTSVTDGDVLLTACLTMSSVATSGSTEQVILPARIKVAAGKGLYFSQTAGAQLAIKTVLYTIL